jgi:hypothetical protein
MPAGSLYVCLPQEACLRTIICPACKTRIRIETGGNGIELDFAFQDWSDFCRDVEAGSPSVCKFLSPLVLEPLLETTASPTSSKDRE